jgi:hypothetical protein
MAEFIDFVDIVQRNDEHGSFVLCRPLLACGHWGTPVHECSSTWDFPHEALFCEECNEERQMDVRLQHILNTT